MSVPLLSVEDLRVEAHGGRAPILDGVSFHIDPAEFVAVVGESGSGKTMAARAILQLLPPGLRQTGGRIVFDGQALGALAPTQMRALRGPGIGLVFQEPMTSLNPALSIGSQLAEGLKLHRGLSARGIRTACVDMLQRVQIRDPKRALSAYPHEFSGGMRQRVMLASVMLLAPKLLIADEPTTALDTLIQQEVLDLMVGLAQDHGTAVMLITHNLGLVGRYARRAVVLEKGKLVEECPSRTLLDAPSHPYTRRLVEALPRRGHASSASVAREPLIAVRDLRVTFPGNSGLLRKREPVPAVRGVDLDIHAGEMVAVVGGSGSGKTTLGRAILRLVPASSGRIRFRGRDVLGRAADAQREFRLASQMIFQDPYSSLDPRMRVAQAVAEPLRHVPDIAGAERGRRVEAVLDEVGLAGYGRRYPHELSGGQRQRVAIARAIVRRPAFIVADEPVSALDMTIQAQVLRLFERLQRDHGFACLFISHDLGAVEQIADRVIVMQRGCIVEEGTRDDIFDRPQHDYTKALLAAAPSLDTQPEPQRNASL
jgi:peptide/nickel transport system ATP-binding protein